MHQHRTQQHRTTRDRTVASVVASLIGDDPPVAVEFYDGSRLGPPDPPATIRVRRPDALARIVTAPGELGFARAYVSGDVEIDGDIYAVIGLRDRLPRPRLTPRQWVDAVRTLGVTGLHRPAPPPEEARLRGRRHTSGRRRRRRLAPLRRRQRLLRARPR